MIHCQDLDGTPMHRQPNANVPKSGGLQDHPLDNAGADAKRPGDLEDAITFGPRISYRRLDGRLDSSPAELRAVLTCPRQPGVDAFPNYAAFEFRKHALEHGLARSDRERGPHPSLGDLAGFQAGLSEIDPAGPPTGRRPCRFFWS
jgi:hypothetical protein